MLPRLNRLTKENDFLRVFNQGKSYYNDYFVIKICPNQLPLSRFAFVVSTKISKKAVIRNLIKRRLREIVKHNLKIIKSGVDVVFLVKSKITDLDFCQLETQVEGAINKARLIECKKS